MKRAVCMITLLVLFIGIFSGCQNQNNQPYLSNPYSGAPKDDYSILFPELFDDNNKSDVSIDDTSLRDGMQFSDGIALITYGKEWKHSAINKEGHILFDLSDEEYDYIQQNNETFQNGILVGENVIYDKTGTIIASPEISGYDQLVSGNCNGYAIAIKTEESYKGNVYKVGVLNNKGQWEYPLSENHPIAKIVREKEQVFHFNTYQLDHIQPDCLPDTIVNIPLDYHLYDYYYNFEENKITETYAHYGKEDSYYAGPIYKFDDSGNKQEIVHDNIGNVFFLRNAFLAQHQGQEQGWKLYDYDGTVLIDLSDYNIVSVGNKEWSTDPDFNGWIYYNDYLLAVIDNGNGDKYLCLFDKSGEPVFEPIKWHRYSEHFSLDDTGFVFKNCHDTNDDDYYFFHCDYEGNITQFENVVSISRPGEELYLVTYADNRRAYINYRGEELHIKFP